MHGENLKSKYRC